MKPKFSEIPFFSGAVRPLVSRPLCRCGFLAMGSNASADMERYRNGYPGQEDDTEATQNFDFYSGKIPSRPQGLLFYSKCFSSIRSACKLLLISE